MYCEMALREAGEAILSPSPCTMSNLKVPEALQQVYRICQRTAFFKKMTSMGDLESLLQCASDLDSVS